MGERSVEHPLVVANRLLADAESAVIADEVADRDGEVSDRIQVAWGRLGLLDRLAVTGLKEVSVVVGSGTESARLDGVVTEVGAGWFSISTATGTALVNVAAVISVSGLGAAARDPETVSAIERARGWTQVLRHFTDQPVVITVQDGSVIKGMVRRVGSDHVDLFVGTDLPTTVTFGAISLVKLLATERM